GNPEQSLIPSFELTGETYQANLEFDADTLGTENNSRWVMSQRPPSSTSGQVVYFDENIPMVGGDYEIIRMIGSGGMGEVWEARQRRLRRDVAIKRIKNLGDDEEMIRMEKIRDFTREALISARLEHPNIVPIH